MGYYDPAVGRFINADGLVSTGQGVLGHNMLAYCNNNPVLYCDTSGLVIEVVGSDSDKKAVELALLYLGGTEEGAKLIKYAEEHPETVTIFIVSTNKPAYYPEEQYIFWDPKAALLLMNGDLISPAVVLGHELYHFQQHMKGADPRTADEKLLHKELLELFENPVCIALGEPWRDNYDDAIGMRNVSGPTDFSHPSPSGTSLVTNLSFVFNLFWTIIKNAMGQN